MSRFPYQRIIVIGVTSAGKSTLAEALAAKLGLTFIELDALYWEPGWVSAAPEVFRQRVSEAVAAPGWVMAGNYNVVRDLTWPRAEVIIWLDYRLRTVFWRLLTRTLRRIWTRELLWGKNRDNLWHHLKLWSQESLFHWLFKTYWRRKREIPQFLAWPEYAHLKLLHFKTPKETEEWFIRLGDI
jgi:adenylate kinase family enzyme